MAPDAKEAALHAFEHEPGCGVLVMDLVGSVGLDLSFASRVFIMEPVVDRSLEQQVRPAAGWASSTAACGGWSRWRCCACVAVEVGCVECGAVQRCGGDDRVLPRLARCLHVA
jgi:hypothetical protein